MDDKYLQILEFPKILDRLSQHTAFSAGRNLALALKPSPDLEEARRRQRETSEARKLLEVKATLSLGGAWDVRPLLQNAGLGATLLPTELLDIQSTLICGRTLKRTITRLAAQFPLLADKASRIEECTHVVAEIGRCINDRGEVVDTASQALARIRRDLKEAHDRLLDKLNRIVASPANALFLQEPLVTQRGGRYVIPLKADFKGRIPGVVHDQSASGATLFIEPLATVELNNRWRELQLEEEREVQRILAALSALVAEESAFIERTVQVLAELDLAFAKARYADEIEGVEPQLAPFHQRTRSRRIWNPPHKVNRAEGRKAVSSVQHPGSTIQLQKARHPLLDPATVVPIDVNLDENYFILVITGPNTGGKTVALKTVGLLGLMAQAGLHIPADEGSALSVFSGIYADIGDEQSIEQNLSTFSSHTTNIINILRKADSHSLVLLDELGAGTHPGEGSALARAILSHLLRQRITTLVATHYPELKVYAHATPGVENASVEFDTETLAPTYELSIGLPGRSNAFAIASRLGLAADIVEEAKSLISSEVLETEELLAEIKQAREDTLAARQAAEEARREAQALEEELRARLDRIEEERREILNAAREEARQELAALSGEIKKIRATLLLPSNLQLPTSKIPEQSLAQVAEELAELERSVAPLEPAVQSRPVMSKPLSVGDVVWVEGLQASGEVIGLDGDEAEIQVARFRVRARQEELERRAVDGEPLPARAEVPTLDVQHPSPGIELNLRGLRVEEVIPRLDKYLNDAYLARLPSVRIVHGKGTGTLRRVVRGQLEGHPLVASYRPGEQDEGGDGVTVVELVSR